MGVVLGRWHQTLADGRVECRLCPRLCRLRNGQRGFCFIRERQGVEIVLTSYGRATAFCVDPIEKKPLAHFFPGTEVLSFGTAGCNLGCKFCQNWDLSKSRDVARLSEEATPEVIARAALTHGCRSVAFTYNDPIPFAEFAIDTAEACRAVGVKAVAVTAGYVTPQARGPFFTVMDAANIDLKAFTPEFYARLCAARLEPVLETLRYVARETECWLEVTTLLIPGQNDSVEEIDRLAEWFLRELGPDVPLHFTAFHPDYRLQGLPRTPAATCLRARDQALRHGVRFVYAGNVAAPEAQATHCPVCGVVVIERDWHAVTAYRLEGDRCGSCGAHVAGRFAPTTSPRPARRFRVHL